MIFSNMRWIVPEAIILREVILVGWTGTFGDSRYRGRDHWCRVACGGLWWRN